jgi:hypothetical protein
MAKADDQMNMTVNNIKARQRSAPTNPLSTVETSMVLLDMMGARDDPRNTEKETMKAKEKRSVLTDPSWVATNIARLDMAKADDQTNMAGNSTREQRSVPTDPRSVVKMSTVFPGMVGARNDSTDTLGEAEEQRSVLMGPTSKETTIDMAKANDQRNPAEDAERQKNSPTDTPAAVGTSTALSDMVGTRDDERDTVGENMTVRQDIPLAVRLLVLKDSTSTAMKMVAATRSDSMVTATGSTNIRWGPWSPKRIPERYVAACSVTSKFVNIIRRLVDPVVLLHPTMATPEQDTDGVEIDPIWTTSRTARQIYALGEVEKVRGSFGKRTIFIESNRTLLVYFN